MRIEVLTIGDELLDGRVVDLHTQTLGGFLFDHYGLSLSYATTVVDDESLIIQALNESVARKTDLLIVSGGLGSTADDLTREAFAKILAVENVSDKKQADYIKDFFTSSKRPWSDNQLKQATYPKGARIFRNEEGLALSFLVSIKQCQCLVLPGVPREFSFFIKQHLPSLLQKKQEMLNACFRVFSLPEGYIDEVLRKNNLPPEGITLSFRAVFPEVQIRIKALNSNEKIFKLFEKTKEEITKLFINNIFSHSYELSFAAQILNKFRNRKKTLSLAESCTGGMIAHLLTEVSGSSNVLKGSLVTYSNESKVSLLKISPQLIKKEGVVSKKVAIEMALQVKKLYQSDFSIATTGYLESDVKKANIWIAVCNDLNEVKVLQQELDFSREKNKIFAVYKAFHFLKNF